MFGGLSAKGSDRHARVAKQGISCLQRAVGDSFHDNSEVDPIPEWETT